MRWRALWATVSLAMAVAGCNAIIGNTNLSTEDLSGSDATANDALDAGNAASKEATPPDARPDSGVNSAADAAADSSGADDSGSTCVGGGSVARDTLTAATPSVHRMVVELERRGLIRRRAGVARSIDPSVPAASIPALC
jgi:hypothetical protein